MSYSTAFKKRYSMAKKLADLRGGSPAVYLADALYCARAHGASAENYFVLRFFAMPDKRRQEYLTAGRSKAADRLLNAKASSDEKAALAKKELFNRKFSSLIRREHLYAPQASATETEVFLRSRDEIIVKPRAGTQGTGIQRIKTSEIADARKFWRGCVENELLLEAVISQHPAIAAINPGCVSSVRVNAARDRQGHIVLIGAALRCGGVGAAADNFHSGGIAYPIDLESGCVGGAGRDNATLKVYFRHPGYDVYMPGLQIPFWSEMLEYVRRGMELVPGMGYVGWDLAVTPQGPEMIEGNFGYPGGNIIQFDGVGKYPLILSCTGEAYEK
jgi:hypothetical protein